MSLDPIGVPAPLQMPAHGFFVLVAPLDVVVDATDVWSADWDGLLYENETEARMEARLAAEAGFRAQVCALVPMGPTTWPAEPSDGPES